MQTGAQNALSLAERLSLPELGLLGAVRAASQISHLTHRCEFALGVLESALDASRSASDRLALHLMFRQACQELGFQVQRTLEPLETMIQQVEVRVKGSRQSGEGARDHQGQHQEERARQEDLWSAHLKELGASEVVASQLATSLAELQHQGRLLSELVAALHLLPASPRDEQLDSLMTRLLELQRLLDVSLRPLVLEDPLPDTLPSFTPGIPTWSARLLAEASRASTRSPEPEPPAPDEPAPVTLQEQT
ncbi:MAG: hypothetical protein AMXMBFR33_02620 [Candidatus Xenobia bacterium]